MITRHLKVHNKNRLSLSFDGGEKSNNELIAGNSAITSSSALSLSSLTPKLGYQNSFSSSHMLDSLAYGANATNSSNNGNNNSSSSKTATNHMTGFSLLPNVNGQDSRMFTQDMRKHDIKSKSTCSLSTL